MHSAECGEYHHDGCRIALSVSDPSDSVTFSKERKRCGLYVEEAVTKVGWDCSWHSYSAGMVPSAPASIALGGTETDKNSQ